MLTSECIANFRVKVNEYLAFIAYASNNTNLSIDIEPNSCVCDACYRDFNRFKDSSCNSEFVPNGISLSWIILMSLGIVFCVVKCIVNVMKLKNGVLVVKIGM